MLLRDRSADDLANWLRQVLRPGAALRSDSRRVGPGDAFFAYPGERQDGRDYLSKALAQGAGALVVEAPDSGSEGCALPGSVAVPVREVRGLKALCGPIASRYHGDPSDALEVLAVTGTNGKTSCTQWIAQGLEWLGLPCAVTGTLGAGQPGGSLQEFGLTTPDALDFQALLARLRETTPARAVAIEASSIGLVQHRLAGSRIAVAVFTNLSRDHLDHHDTMQAYAQAKALLFGWPGLKAAVIHLDDAWAHEMFKALPPEVPCIGTSMGTETTRPARGVRRLIARQVHQGPDGMDVLLDGDFGQARVQTALIGQHNVANLLSVAATWLSLGYGLTACVEMLARLGSVPGRLERITLAPDSQEEASRSAERLDRALPLVLVDYAHTPDALDKVLAALRALADARAGQIWCVLGAGGDRDPGKRPQMAAVAQARADRVVLTSDNPRHESPERILDDLVGGLTQPPALRDVDRARAIAWTVAQAQPADLILIAGKGHETYQEVRGERRPFSDAVHARAALRRRAGVSCEGACHA
jgi:UDP-N-acetylmuramyl-tripeptide synthetase